MSAISNSATEPPELPAQTAPANASDHLVTDQYLSEYDALYYHVGMLRDMERMKAYHDAIKLNSAAHFRGKVVLDVGSGTGVLAVWAAQAGAKRVYAVEASSIGEHTATLIAAHGFSTVVTVLRGRMEDLELPEKVDVIVSEWMGYFLLRESMVSSVLLARDRWLKPGGVMYPSEARLLLAPLHSPSLLERRQAELEDSMAEWDAMAAAVASRFSLDMSSLRAAMYEEHFEYTYRQGWQGPVPGVAMAADPSQATVLLRVDMHTSPASDFFGWSTEVELHTRDEHAHIDAVCGWFDVRFCGSESSPADACVELDTSPFAPKTHWGQTVLVLNPPMMGPHVRVGLRQSVKSHHDLNFTMEYNDVSVSYEIGADFRGFDGDEGLPPSRYDEGAAGPGTPNLQD